MKKVFLFLLTLPFFLFMSCSEDFNINAPYDEMYILNCIIRSDNSIQYAIISKNRFTEDGTLPVSDGADQNIKGADIKIFYSDSVFVMRDTTIQVMESGKELLVNCYYLKGLEINPGESIKISATVPDGKLLESTIKVPSITYRNFRPFFPEYFPKEFTENPTFEWSWNGKSKQRIYIMNLPQLEIYYKKNEGGIFIDKKKLVPLSYYPYIDDKGILQYTDLKLSFNNYCFANLNTVTKAMQEISGNDPHKENYIINRVLLDVISMDEGLSKFYSSYNNYTNDYTIKLRQTDYSNIEGGKGIFGASYRFSKPMILDTSYVNSFGYQLDTK